MDVHSEWNSALDAAAEAIETHNFKIVDFGEAAPGKVFAGVCTFNNQQGNEKELAALVRSLKRNDI